MTQTSRLTLIHLVLLACSDDPLSLGANDGAVTSSQCPSGEVMVTTQAEVDALAGCASVDGSLSITGTLGDGLSLLPLDSLRLVSGTLKVESVSSLAGLESLEQVGNLQLTNLGERSLNSLVSLSRVVWDPPGSGDGGVIGVFENGELQSLSGLEQLTTWQRLYLSSNPQLTSLSGVSGPPRVSEVSLYDLPALQDANLPFLREADAVNIEATGIQRLLGFPLTKVEHLGITNNPVLESLDGLSRLLAVDSLSIVDNPALLRIGLSQLEEVHSVYVVRNASLEEVPFYNTAALQSLQIGDTPLVLLSETSYEVSDNAQLTRITLPETFVLVQQVAIWNNPQLAIIDLNDLSRADGLTITDNPSLSLVLANSLKRVGDLEVVNNPALSVAPFADVQTFSNAMRGNLDGPLPLPPLPLPPPPAE